MPDSPFMSMFQAGGMFDPAAMRQQKAYDMLGGMGAALLQASAPTFGPPRGFLDVLGTGLVGANQAAQGGEDRTLKRTMMGLQAAQLAQDLKSQQEWTKDWSGAGTPAATATPNAPIPLQPAAGGMDPDRARFIQTMMPHALEVSKATGLDPRLVLAQSALETGYGSAAPGNNYFGIKSHGAPGGQVLPTTEVGSNGPYQANESFRTYADPGASARDYAEFLKSNSRYQPVLAAQGLDAQIDAMGRSGYATDPNYTAKLRQIAQTLPGVPQGLIPPGPPPAPMPQVGGAPAPGIPGPIAPPPQVAQGDGSGNPVQQAQYQAPQSGVQTLADIRASIPPGVRQIIAKMKPKEGMAFVLQNYGKPDYQAALDINTGQVVFANKNALGSGRYQPIDAAKLQMEGERLKLDQRKAVNEEERYKTEQKQKGQFVRGADGVQRWVTADQYAGGMPNYDKPPTEIEQGNYDLARRRAAVEEANKDVVVGPDGRPQINQQVVDAKTTVSSKQGTDAVGKMLIGDYDDARKANTEMQSGALMARTGMAQTNRLANLLDQVNTGKYTSTAQEIKRTAKSLGIDLEALGVRDDTAPAQAIQALRGQMALSLRNPSQGAGMPGAMSDADRQYLDRMVAGLENTPEGNKLMLDASRKLYQRQIDMAKIANDFMRSPEAKKDPNALYQKLQEYAEKNPLFSESDIPAGGMSPMPSSGPAAPSGAPAPPAGFKVIGR